MTHWDIIITDVNRGKERLSLDISNLTTLKTFFIFSLKGSQTENGLRAFLCQRKLRNSRMVQKRLIGEE